MMSQDALSKLTKDQLSELLGEVVGEIRKRTEGLTTTEARAEFLDLTASLEETIQTATGDEDNVAGKTIYGTKYNFSGAQFAGGFAANGGNQSGGTINNVVIQQHSGTGRNIPGDKVEGKIIDVEIND